MATCVLDPVLVYKTTLELPRQKSEIVRKREANALTCQRLGESATVGVVRASRRPLPSGHNRFLDRVQASPSWDAPFVDLFFWFLRDGGDATFEGRSWADLLVSWLQLVPPEGRFQSVEGELVSLEDLTAGEYLDSDPLDLDHLSEGPR